MSRVGKQPIILPQEVKISGGVVQGPKGTVKVNIPRGVEVVNKDGILTIAGGTNNIQGLTRTLIANAIKGVTVDWSKTLELSGTGYRANVANGQLQLAMGFSHPVAITAPDGIEFVVKENKITVWGPDKALVGLMAARIRGVRPADPYKAKGFIYEGEKIIRKAGKAAKTGGTTK